MITHTWKQGLLALPGVVVSMLPKLMCPACWPAYAAPLSSVGIGFLISMRYLLPLTALFLALALGSLASRASGRRGLGPFWTGVLAAALVLIGKFYIDSASAAYAGVSLLITASVWNTWPRRNTADLCPACLPAEESLIGEETRKGEASI
jgi:mercuric ion transport protein